MDGTLEHLGWYAIQVASKKEQFVASVLTEKGYQCSLPLYPKRTIWSDPIKVTSVPLLADTYSPAFDVRYRLPILVTPNFLRGRKREGSSRYSEERSRRDSHCAAKRVAGRTA